MRRVILFFCLLLSSSAYASHNAGLSLTVRYTGGADDYIVTCTFYRDCFGIPAPPSLPVWYEKNGVFQNALTLPAIYSNMHYNTICVTGTPINCAGGFGMEIYIYETMVSLPPNGLYKFYTAEIPGGLPSQIPNYVEAFLDLQNSPYNSLPMFSSNLETYYGVAMTTNYPSFVTDIDGDSVVYSFAPALIYDSTTLVATPMTYLPGNSPSTFNIFSPATLSANGTITFTPALIGVGFMNIKADEYRNGTWIGTVMRLSQIVVSTSCIVDINEHNAGLQPDVFPNPALDKLYIKSSVPVDAFEITDLSGRCIISEKNLNNEINVSQLMPGIYYLHVSADESRKAIHFIKK